MQKRGEVILLQLNHCIYLGDKKNDAITCPNQLRLFGIHVDERLATLFLNETNAQYIIANGIQLDLKTKGPLTFLPVRRPTKQELNNSDLDLIMLTSPHGWDPYNVDSSRIVTDLNGCDPYQVNSLRTITDLRSCPISHYLDTTISRNFNEVKFKRKNAITPEDLISRWGIGIETARLTLKCTYQEYTR